MVAAAQMAKTKTAMVSSHRDTRADISMHQHASADSFECLYRRHEKSATERHEARNSARQRQRAQDVRVTATDRLCTSVSNRKVIMQVLTVQSRGQRNSRAAQDMSLVPSQASRHCRRGIQSGCLLGTMGHA